MAGPRPWPESDSEALRRPLVTGAEEAERGRVLVMVSPFVGCQWPGCESPQFPLDTSFSAPNGAALSYWWVAYPVVEEPLHRWHQRREEALVLCFFHAVGRYRISGAREST